ncbi:uncharacterized protein LOC133204946 [Saccostrea echinata]|uniref:uncharacterized protein LOC133204946 n=1 Tax=Saccostrea echinata TaxID=191078 RepID=UPI002A813EBF|nr:uncharacterized protein LOC133204946 [Saccostrea echinata]
MSALRTVGMTSRFPLMIGGAIFVHWGKQRCPDNDTELVYSGWLKFRAVARPLEKGEGFGEGYLGGSEYKTPGATVTTVCLSPDPIFGSRNPVHLSNNMHGSEIDTDFFGPGTGTQDNTCAVCKSRLHTTSVMIPGRNECYQGWKKQYSGYLMSSPVGNYSPKDSICLNEHPEFVVGGGVNSNGNLLYPIKAVCGSLECPPYVDGKLITCVVCTQ